MSIYKPPNNSNRDNFFNEITISLTKAYLHYENLIAMGDFNIDISTASAEVDKLESFTVFFI